MNDRWKDVLPRPVAFVLSGGAALGAIQVGMLKALRQANLYPDLVVGTSVGALNGAVIADKGLDDGIDSLETLWRRLSREDIFPGGRMAQARHLLANRTSLFPNDRLGELGCAMLSANRYEDLRLPFAALATELLTFHGALFRAGALHPTLLASAAIPGVFPPVEINGVMYVDGALTAYVPMGAAVRMGAATLVVLDAGDTCHRKEPPRNVAEMFFSAMQAALRQRVGVEATAIANQRPVVYLPTPCPISKNALDFGDSAALMEQAYAMATDFLATAPLPEPASMCGAPHFHDDVPVRDMTILTGA